MNNIKNENGKEYNLNLFRVLGVGNNKLGLMIMYVYQKTEEDEFGSLNFELMVDGKSDLDIEDYKTGENVYHVEFESQMLDVVVHEDSIDVGFSCGEDATVQTLSLKE